MPRLHVLQRNLPQIRHHAQRARKVVVRGKAVGRYHNLQPRRPRGLQAVGRIFKRQAGRCGQAQALQGLLVHLRMRLFVVGGRGVFDHGKALVPIFAHGPAQQGGDVDGRCGGGNGQLHACGMGAGHQLQHARAHGHGACLHGLFVKRGFEFVQARHCIGHAPADIDQIGLHLPPVVQDALFAARHFQQARVFGCAPVPVAAFFGKGAVECGQVGGFGIGNGAVHIKNQGLQHGGFSIQIIRVKMMMRHPRTSRLNGSTASKERLSKPSRCALLRA